LVLSPVFDEVSPCGNVSLALVAADLALRGVVDQVGGTAPAPVAAAFANAYGQVFLVGFTVDSAPCESIPARQSDTRCNVDDHIGSATASLPVPSGLPLPVDPVGLLPIPTDPALLGALVEALAAAQGHAAPDAGISQQLAGSLGCKTTQRLRRAPAVGSAGGGVDLTRRATQSEDSDTTPSARSPKSRVLPRTSSEIDAVTTASPVVDSTSPSGTSTTPRVAAAASASTERMSDTRQNVYRILALLLAGAAAWGFISPRKRDEAGA
jgi:hypothetical protein